ncbi:MAG: hypothetical protein GF350_13385 [Chitinivibrionales bacterium]|nr:hypothetical protein [Chitinivibrionales bacterium]
MRGALLISGCLTALLCGALGCGSQPTAGGTGTETVNTYAFLSTGEPARGATVRVIDAEGWLDSTRSGSSPVIESTVVGDDGRFSMDPRTRAGIENLQIDYPGEALLLRHVHRDRLSGDTIRLDVPASYGGTLSSGTAPISRLLLAGSAYQADVDASGAFSFPAVAAQAYAALIVTNTTSPGLVTGGSVNLAPGENVTDTGLNVSPARLLVDNFEGGVGPSALGLIRPVLSWYAYSDSFDLTWDWDTRSWEWSKSIKGAPYGHSDMTITAIPDDRGGTAAEFVALLDSAYSYPYAGIGIPLASLKSGGVDLSSMSAFSLRAAGSGTIRIRLETQLLRNINNSDSHFTYSLALDSTWRKYTIPIDSFTIQPALSQPGQYTWQDVARNVEFIEFHFSHVNNPGADTLQLRIDDVYLENVTLDSLLLSR